MYCPCSGYTIGDVPFSVFQCHSILCEHKAFQFYIVALIAQGLTGLPRIEAISILYSSINRKCTHKRKWLITYFNSI